MPTEDDFPRRHVTQNSCPAGCPAPVDHLQYPAQQERYSSDNNLQTQDRYHERFSERSSSDRLPSGERYQGGSERYPLGERPSTSISSERLAKEVPVQGFMPERYNYERNQRYQNVGSLDRYHERYQRADRYYTISNEKCAPMEARSDRKERYQRYNHDQYLQECYTNERFPVVPCPERFATFTQVPYMEPPSPAPASDRFIPPPPLSPENTPSPDCYPSNPFPSPTTTVPPPERFIPPPPLSPSPTENYSPKKIPKYDKRYQYAQYKGYGNQPGHDRYSGERYVPPNAHMPVERYIPQDHYYYQNYDHRYPKYSNGDPYMRRDLAFHYRFPVAYPTNQFQRMRYSHVGTPNRLKCCAYQEGYHLSKSSPGSSSSSSVTSQGKDLQKELVEYQPAGYQQEKGIQCSSFQNKDVGFVVAKETNKTQCRHVVCASPGVEYVGQSGGRHVCATPPPRGSVGSGDSVCSEQCCGRRAQSSLAVAVWRATPTKQLQPKPPTTPQPPQQPSPSRQPLPSSSTSSSTVADQPEQDASSSTMEQRISPPSRDIVPSPKPPPVQRAVSMPASTSPRLERYREVNYSQSQRLPGDRPTLARSTSRKEAIKNFIKKETASFFGVDEESEAGQRERWRDRRIRLASRTYGALKEEFKTPRARYLRRTMSEVPPRTEVMYQPQMSSDRPDVLPGSGDLVDVASQDRLQEGRLRGKDSVARMTWDGISYVVSTLTRHQPRQRTRQTRFSRSYPPDVPSVPSTAEEDSFFERLSTPTSPQGELLDTVVDSRQPVEALPRSYFRGGGGWKIETHSSSRREEERPTVGCSRIVHSFLDRVFDNSDRRQYGMGWVGRMFGRRMRNSVTENEEVMEQLDDIEDHRPMFTYWVTTVQILVLIISLFCYGFGPFGVDMQSRSGQVLVTSLSLQQVDYMEPANFWFGPRAADLIHLGAKFGPCMRVDNKIIQQIDITKARERDTACCIRNDDSGCVQSSQADCSKTISTWKKWSAGESGPGGRISGSVCGLDPKFCDAPASVHPYEWPDDITKWPICRKKTNTQYSMKKGVRDKLAEHMVCEVIGHPCCIGIHGQCRITTKEYCDFVRGTFHEEASLCSQVSCLNDVCGMIPFYFPLTPDQFYRLWTSLFLHAGILQLVITVVLQYLMMRDLEKLTGSLRIGIIYIGSGMGGNLASAIFVPYRADVGPAGSQFGLLACLIVEVLNAWPMLKHPRQALCKLISITVFLFFVGLLPWVDNYAHLFGFIFGFLLSYALLPFVSFGKYERRKKIFLIWVCLLTAGALFLLLVLLFYVFPVYDCKICSYFNCLPLTNDFCASQNINFKREEPVV